MELYLVKPDLTYFAKYNEMMIEWNESKTQIAPCFLDKPFETVEEFAEFVQMLDRAEQGILDKKYASTTSYFVIDENGRLVGATSLRHYLTEEGYKTWGHIGYGVRPSERRKGYGTLMLKLMLEEAKKRHIYDVLMGAHTSNIASCKVIEKCGGVLKGIVDYDNDDGETISQYWIDNK